MKTNNAKSVYPVFIKKDKKTYLVYLPDVNSYTEGNSMYDAVNMARDLLGTLSLENNSMPKPSSADKAQKIATTLADDKEFKYSDGTVTYVDVDFDAYRKEYDQRMIRKNVTIPAWLNAKAEKAGISFSRVLQDSLMKML